MNSINSQNRMTFTSRNHPISKHIFPSLKGNITISEASLHEYKRIERFVLDTAIKANEQYAHFGRPENSNLKEVEINKVTKMAIAKSQKCDNYTLLTAKDIKGKIVGSAIISPVMEEAGELTQFYIDEKYRNIGLGKHMGQLLLNSVKNFFTDVLVMSENTAIGFYKNLGFQFPQKVKGDNLSSLIAAAEKAIAPESRDFVKVGHIGLNPEKTVADLFRPYKPK